MLNFIMDFGQDTENHLDRRLGVAEVFVVANKALTENEHKSGGIAGAGFGGGFGGPIRL